MSNRQAMNDFLTKRWNDTDAPSSGTAVSVSSQLNDTPIGTQQRHNLETLIYSIRNFVGAGGAVATVTVSVRHATPAGTVMASFDHLIAASSVVNVSMTEMGFQGKRGKAIRVTMDTVVASLTQKVSIAGWIEDD
jgi:alkaline phosphatase